MYLFCVYRSETGRRILQNAHYFLPGNPDLDKVRTTVEFSDRSTMLQVTREAASDALVSMLQPCLVIDSRSDVSRNV